MEVEIRIERKRGCGWRKGGGLYLVAPQPNASCCRLPMPLDVCPTCGHGIKPARGFTWMDLEPFKTHCTDTSTWSKLTDFRCPLAPASDVDRVGLIWVGEKYYKLPVDFALEAINQGISRRITTIPHGFKLGETWIMLAHRKAITRWVDNPDEPEQEPQLEQSPGAFMIFKPTAIEYVVKGDESEEKLERLVKRGITLVKVEKAEQQEMFQTQAVH